MATKGGTRFLLLCATTWFLQAANAKWMGSDVYAIDATGGTSGNENVLLKRIADERAFHVDRTFNTSHAVVRGVLYTYLVANNGDLFAIKRSATGTHSTEVHVLPAATDYTRYALEVGTPLEETGAEPNRWAFALASNRDLYVFKKFNTGTHSTEIHVLSAASNYQSYLFQTGTVLGEDAGGDWTFAVASNADVLAIKRQNTGTHSTEVHVLPRSNFYQAWGLQTGTPLEETGGGDWAFALASNRDLYAIKKSATGTSLTELHVLTATSNYQTWALRQGTDVAQSPGSDFHFAVANAVSIEPRESEFIVYEGTYYGGRNYVYDATGKDCVTVNNIQTTGDMYGRKCPHDQASSAKFGSALDYGEYDPDDDGSWFSFDKNGPGAGEDLAFKPVIDPVSAIKRVPSFQPRKYCDNNQITYYNCNDRLSSFRICHGS